MRKFSGSLYEAGEEWDRQQRRKGSQRVGRAQTDRERREYRLVNSFHGKREDAFHRETVELMESTEAWAAIPAAQRTSEQETLTFLLLARGLSRNHNQKDRNKNYPNKLLATIAEPSLIAEVAADAECDKRLDDASKQVVAQYGADGLASEGCQRDLTTMALIARAETLQIEWGHQRIRRFIYGRSN